MILRRLLDLTDAPDQDIDSGNEGEVHCVPTAFAERNMRPEGRNQFRVLLKLHDGQKNHSRSFIRFGITKLVGSKTKVLSRHCK